MTRDAPPDAEVLFEFKRVGAYVQVCAIHTGLNIEAQVSGPAAAPIDALKAAAVRRLAMIINGRRETPRLQPDRHDPGARDPRDRKPGVLV